jgi:hypothetical protein
MMAVLLYLQNSHDLASFLCMAHICLDRWLVKVFSLVCTFYIIYDRVREVFGRISMPFFVNLNYASTSCSNGHGWQELCTLIWFEIRYGISYE